MPLISLQTDLWQFRSALSGPQHPCNGYIVRVEDEFHLIDPPEDLIAAVLPLSLPVAHIFLTHTQEEHGLGAFNFPRAIVHVPSGDEYLCRGLDSYRNHLTQWQEPWDWESRGCYQGHLAGAPNERPLPPVTNLGQPLVRHESLLGYRVIPTPGHGKNAVTLMREIDGRKVAFCGDLIHDDARLWNWFDCDWDYGLETGQKSLAASCLVLEAEAPDRLCPAHGDMIAEPQPALRHLHRKIASVLVEPPTQAPDAINFPEPEEPVPGWRRVSPSIFQWKGGNTCVLLSRSRRAIVIDDGLCLWLPLKERRARHDAAFAALKSALGIKQIDWIIPTHYHGDHIDFIPRLAAQEKARVLCLDSIAPPMTNPEQFPLACPLPWYNADAERISIDHYVSEGEVFPWEEYSLRFFRLGGQTWHHLGIEAQVDGKRVLFVGDGFWGTSSDPGSALCWNDAEPSRKGWVFALNRMIEARPDLLVCGHGSALVDPMPYLNVSLATWERRLARFESLNAHASRELFFSPFEGGC